MMSAFLWRIILGTKDTLKGSGTTQEGKIHLFTGGIDTFRKGKDELNLAEFPISVVAEAAPPGQLTLTFSDTIKDKSTGKLVDRSVTVHGTEEWGLPAAQDDDVMIGLLQLCYLTGWPKTLRFTRYQLCRILRWSVGGASYLRIYKALHRLSTTNYNYRYAWRDRTNQEWIPSQVFSYIQALKVHEADRPTDSGLCEVTWSDDFHRSLEAGNLKGIDFEMFVGLKRSISKRLYRFLDKRFGGGWVTVTYRLDTLAFEKIGISRNYKDAAQIKRLILPAIKELESLGYLEPVPPEERFRKVSRGVWEVSFQKFKKPSLSQSRQPAERDLSKPVEARLIELDVFPTEAKKFVSEYPREYLEQKIDEFPFRSADTNPGGLLADSIRKNMQPPPGYQLPADRQAAQAEAERKQKIMQSRAHEQKQKEDALLETQEQQRALAEKTLNLLSESELDELEQVARRQFPKAGPKAIRQLMISTILNRGTYCS